tara:strand:+ start:1055 stop:1318 length:264 start_codon:yes stop_codon:yes gene_type:complete
MKNLMSTDTFPQFCNRAFWGRWDTALVNIAVLLLTSFGFVKGGQYVGVLFDPLSLTGDIATACLVTITILAIGLADKKQSRETTGEQ